MQISEIITAYGHENIRATHQTTLEITKEDDVSEKGNCIIAVSADKALADLDPRFKKNLCKENARLAITIEVGEIVEHLNAFGSSRLIPTHPMEMVVRKSGFVCGRTLAVRADKAACDLSKMLIRKLQDRQQKVRITLTVDV